MVVAVVWCRVRREPAEVVRERHETAMEANRARRKEQQDKNEARAKMKVRREQGDACSTCRLG